ncbi:hypothetical protein Hanom_Chr01g00055171 [Helianthus anomalus]
MSLTRLSVGSQLTPYQLVQQSVPVHVFNMPKYGSVRPDLNASNASRSAGVQEVTTATVAARSKTATVTASFIFCFL